MPPVVKVEKVLRIHEWPRARGGRWLVQSRLQDRLDGTLGHASMASERAQAMKPLVERSRDTPWRSAGSLCGYVYSVRIVLLNRHVVLQLSA
jgi:hypothetical protein